MKTIFAVSFLIVFMTETAQAQKVQRGYERTTYESGATDQTVIKELQREVLEGVQLGRQNRQLSGKDARSILKQYSRINSREIKLYKKRRINQRMLTQVRTDLESLVQQLYTTVRFDKSQRGGWVRAKRY